MPRGMYGKAIMEKYVVFETLQKLTGTGERWRKVWAPKNSSNI